MSLRKGLPVAEVFSSFQGEVCRVGQGRVTTFVRLYGCNLRCKWCDTKHAQEIPEDAFYFTPNMVWRRIVECGFSYGAPSITITGGEPLLYPDTRQLINLLVDKNCHVSVETNGTQRLPVLSKFSARRVSFVVDYKLPGSGEECSFNYDILNQLRPVDYIKFVVACKKDLNIAMGTIAEFKQQGLYCDMAISAVDWNDGMAGEILRMSKQSYLSDIILNVQIHKFVNVK